MGFVFSKLFNTLFGSKDLRILILGNYISKYYYWTIIIKINNIILNNHQYYLGLDNAGKTTILCTNFISINTVIK